MVTFGDDESCTPRSAPRALRTAGMKRPDFSYQKMEYKLSEQLRMRFPQMTSLPIGNEYQIIKAEERLRSMTSERRRHKLLNWEPAKESPEERMKRRCEELERYLCTRKKFDAYASTTKCVGPGVRPVQVSVRVVDLAASKSGSGVQSMQFEQYEKCMEDLGVYNGEVCRPYHDGQQTQQGIPDRSVRPVGQDNRYRLSDLEWLILSKAGQETDAGDPESKSKLVAGKRGGINKGAIAMTFQEALRHSENGYGNGHFGTAKNRGLDFNGFCRATRYAIRLCVYGPHYRTKRGAKRKKREKESEKIADMEARNKLEVSAAPVSSAIVPPLDLRAATARPVTHVARVRPATERAKTEMGVDGDTSGDVKEGEASTTPKKLGLSDYFFGEPLKVKHNDKNLFRHRFEKGDGPLANEGGEGESAHQLAKRGRGGSGNLTSRPLTVKPSGAESLLRHRSGAVTDRQLQTAQASRPHKMSTAEDRQGFAENDQDFWKQAQANARQRLVNPPPIEYYEKGFESVPANNLGYLGNGFFQVKVDGARPRLIKTDKDLLDAASKLRWWERKNEKKLDANVTAPFPTAAAQGEWALGSFDCDPARIAGRAAPPSRMRLDPYAGKVCPADLKKA